MINKSSLKIIAGKFKGLNLYMPTTSQTRSSKAILKESLFNTIAFDINNACFIEAFSGSGSIGIEALSRGAESAMFFEVDKQAFEILDKNLKMLFLKDSNLNAKAFFGNTFELLPKRISNITNNKKIIYLDPPFNIRDKYADIYEKCVELISQILHYGVFLVVFEHNSDYILPQNIINFCIIKTKKFGKSSLSYYISS